MAQRSSPVLENKIYSAQEIKANDALAPFSIQRTRNRTTATSVSATVTDATCYGSTFGKIFYTISGNNPPYSYQWSNGTSGSVYTNCSYTIQVNNPGAATLIDYQVMVTIPYAPTAGMNADFSNVSFSDTNNVVPYSFWKESTSNISGDFWIKIPSFPPGNSFIRVSCCSTSSTSLSSGPATFEYFDDFNDQNIADWTNTINDLDYPDETADTSIQQVNGADYAVKLNSYAHCIGTGGGVGISNQIAKTIILPPGQYWVDVSSKFLVCLRTICSDTARIYSRIYIDNVFYSAFYLEKNTTCGCALSDWTQIRANGPITYSGASIAYDLRTELTDCTDGEIQYDNFRLRKWYVDPVVTIDVPKTLSLTNLAPGDYTLTVTDGAGNVTIETYTVNGLSAPQVNDYATCGKTPVTLIASGPYTTFQWYNTPGGGTSLFTGASYTTDSLDRDQIFYVSGIGQAGCQSFPRTPAKVTLLTPETSPTCLTVYTGISPNGDGLNETWEIKGIESYPNNKIKVFDRWGNIVFEKESYNNRMENTWKGVSNNGLSKGQDLPNGTYYYEIHITGLSKPLSGFVILNREQ